MVPAGSLPDFSAIQWLLAGLAATGIGVSKSGLPGLSLLHVVIFAQLFPGIASTGIVLPMLICGDVGAFLLFRRTADWKHVMRTLPPAVVGVWAGWWVIGKMQAAGADKAKFGPWIGGIVLILAGLQLLRDWRPGLWEKVPHWKAFAWTLGLVAGVTTMLANAAGPVMSLYLLSVSLPKEAFVGTGAAFFLLINLIKVLPAADRGLITGHSLLFNAVLLPFIIIGLFVGKRIVARLSQKGFDTLVLVFAIVASLRLLGVF
jgi:uncharacterized membrane protein YfcA